MYRHKKPHGKPLFCEGARAPMTHTLYFGWALMAEGWRRDVRVTLAQGAVAALETGAAPQPQDERHALAAPGLANVHSHAFQRAMAGLAERRGPGEDSFWSWRETMYRFALTMTPDQMQAVAAQAYVEMLEAGFTRVGEFHYLHHAPGGGAYGDIAEMSGRLVAAAAQAGIGLTLLPVFYAHSNFGGAPPGPAQRRFVCDLDAYARLIEGARRALATLPGADLGFAPHSLRAVTPPQLAAVAAMAAGAPVHIHVSEQTAEVDACLAAHGARPVEYLLDVAPVDARWCLIHATHMTRDETRALAARGAVVGLCPITEANLGDGVFDAPGFLDAGGRFAIGTDSNVLISLSEELRLLEYGQRLTRRARNVLAEPGGSTGRALFDTAQRAGLAALARPGAGLRIGAEGDIVTLRGDALERLGDAPDAALDAWIFSGAAEVDCVFARGRAVVRDGAHVARAATRARFRAVMQQMSAL